MKASVVAGTVAVLYLLVGLGATMAVRPDTTEQLCRTRKGTSIDQHLLIWPLTVYAELNAKRCLG